MHRFIVQAHLCCQQAVCQIVEQTYTQDAVFVVLQNFSNTLQVVFADVAAHSMQPLSSEPSTSAPQATACACEGAATSKDSSAMPTEIAHPTSSCAGDPVCQHPPALSLSQQQPAHSATLPERSNTTGTTQAADGGEQHVSVSSDACLAPASSEGRGEEEGQATGQIGGYRWQLPAGISQDECIMLWVGPDTVPTLTHLHLTYNK